MFFEPHCEEFYFISEAITSWPHCVHFVTPFLFGDLFFFTLCTTAFFRKTLGFFLILLQNLKNGLKKSVFSEFYISTRKISYGLGTQILKY